MPQQQQRHAYVTEQDTMSEVDSEVLDGAAIMIQAAWRGFSARLAV